MKNTTLCYIEKDSMYLMMHRVKKKNDENEGKYIGIGGHFLENESPIDCIIREAKEETGLDIKPIYRGIVTFVSNVYETQQMHLFTCQDYEGEITPCSEGELKWIKKSELDKIPLWEGDKIFLDLLNKDAPFFVLKLVYENDTLKEYHLN